MTSKSGLTNPYTRKYIRIGDVVKFRDVMKGDEVFEGEYLGMVDTGPAKGHLNFFEFKSQTHMEVYPGYCLNEELNAVFADDGYSQVIATVNEYNNRCKKNVKLVEHK